MSVFVRSDKWDGWWVFVRGVVRGDEWGDVCEVTSVFVGDEFVCEGCLLGVQSSFGGIRPAWFLGALLRMQGNSCFLTLLATRWFRPHLNLSNICTAN